MACTATLKRSLEFDPLHAQSPTPNKRRRCIPAMTLSPSTPPTKLRENPSPFREFTPLSSEQIADALTTELKKIQRRRQLAYPCSMSPPPSDISISPDRHENFSQASCSLAANLNLIPPAKKDQPIFTFRQVSMICEHMLKEREEKIREEYDQVLNSKMSEQYEAFLKFNHDQLHRRFGDTPMSYVS